MWHPLWCGRRRFIKKRQRHVRRSVFVNQLFEKLHKHVRRSVDFAVLLKITLLRTCFWRFSKTHLVPNREGEQKYQNYYSGVFYAVNSHKILWYKKPFEFYSNLDSDNLVCPDGVTKFSSGVNSPEYYECKEVGKKAILKTCPMGNIYHAIKQRCESVELPTNNSERTKRSALGNKRVKSSDDLETFKTMVLGRIVHIGDLYDAKKGEVLAGVSFWKGNTIRKNIRRSFLPSMRTHFCAGKTSFERLDRMNIKA